MSEIQERLKRLNIIINKRLRAQKAEKLSHRLPFLPFDLPRSIPEEKRLQVSITIGIAAVLLILLGGWGLWSLITPNEKSKALSYDVVKAESRLLKNPTDIKTLLNLGHYYFEWAGEIDKGPLDIAGESNDEGNSSEINVESFRTQLDQWKQLGYDVSQLEPLLKDNPSAFLSRYAVMKGTISREMYEKSIRYTRMAMAFGAEPSPEEIYRLGIAYFKSGKFYYYQAAKYLQQALDRGLASSKAYTFLGNISYEMGDLDLAVSRYEQAGELAPEDPICIFNLGWIYKEKRLPETAIQQFRRVLEIYAKQGPESELKDQDRSTILKTRFLLGWLYLEKGDSKNAIAELSETLKSQPRSVHILYWLGKSYAAAGNKQEARKCWATLLKIEPNYRDTQTLLKRL